MASDAYASWDGHPSSRSRHLVDDEGWFHQPTPSGRTARSRLEGDSYDMAEPSVRHLPYVSPHSSSQGGLRQAFAPQHSLQDQQGYNGWPAEPTSMGLMGLATTPSQWYSAPSSIHGDLDFGGYGLPAGHWSPNPAGDVIGAMDPAGYATSGTNSLHSSFSSHAMSDMSNSFTLDGQTDQGSLASLAAAPHDYKIEPWCDDQIAAASAASAMAFGRQDISVAAVPTLLLPTVSPKLTRIRPSPTPTLSSESTTGNFFAGSDSDVSLPHYEASAPAKRSHLSAVATPSSSRHQLPEKRRQPRYIPILPNTGRRSVPRTVSSGETGSGQSANARPFRPSLLSAKPRKHSEEQPTSAAKMAGGNKGHSESRRHATSPPRSAEQERSAKNDFLVQSKLAGMTYKEIRRKGGFTEAESTLRGRFRTLTKQKEARVRRPEWTENDLYLLEQAVRSLATGPEIVKAKIPWKQVAEYIYERGGTYLFGNSTCRKRWDVLVFEEVSCGKDLRWPFYEQ